MVGWYHSRPNLGAFFNATDRSTPHAFFGQPYSAGWVLDPDRVEQKAFVAQDSIKYPVPQIILDHALERANPLSELQDADTAVVEVKMIPTARSGSEPVEVTADELSSARGSRK